MGEGWISGSTPSILIEKNLADNESADIRYNKHNGVMDGSMDPSLPYYLTHMGVQVGDDNIQVWGRLEVLAGWNTKLR